jgi:hypothetical protein
MISNRIKRTAMGIYEGESISAELVEPSNPNRKSYFLLYLIAALVALGGFVLLINVLMKLTTFFV